MILTRTTSTSGHHHLVLCGGKLTAGKFGQHSAVEAVTVDEQLLVDPVPMVGEKL